MMRSTRAAMRSADDAARARAGVRFHAARFAPYLLCTMLSACAVGPDFKAPAAPQVQQYTETPMPIATGKADGALGQAQHFDLGGRVDAQWWAAFGSTELDALINAAIERNPTLEQARATLRQASEDLNAQRGTSQMPAIDASLGDTRTKDPGTINSSSPPTTTYYNLYNAKVTLSYSFDVFGGARRAVEAAGANADYQAFEVQATQATLAANVATAALTEADARARIAATHEILTLERTQLDIITQQFQLGGATYSDVLQQRTRVDQTESTLPALEQKLAITRHQLYAYAGMVPGEGGLPTFDLASMKLPQALPVSLPSVLVRQRPDIRAAEAQLHVANANVGIATANLYPQFTLNADILTDAFSPVGMAAAIAQGFDLGGAATQPLFHGGALNAKRRSAMAARDAAAAQYRGVVLSAFRDVADALKALEYDAQALKTNEAGERDAAESLQLAQAQYRIGSGTFVTLLLAQQDYQQARLALVDAQVARLTDTVALYLALGGGWDGGRDDGRQSSIPDSAPDLAQAQRPSHSTGVSHVQ